MNAARIENDLLRKGWSLYVERAADGSLRALARALRGHKARDGRYKTAARLLRLDEVCFLLRQGVIRNIDGTGPGVSGLQPGRYILRSRK